MTLRDRFEQLDPRERRLLNALVIVFALIIVVALPLGCSTMLSGKRSHNRALREAISKIHDSRALLQQREAATAKTLARYRRKTPELAGFLETLAKRHEIEIPESQERPSIPHGKDFEERSNKIVLRRVGMLPLAKFLEGIVGSSYPVTISELNLNKRGPDSYDVTLIVSAFDLKEKPQKESSDSAGGDAGTDGAAAEEGEKEGQDAPDGSGETAEEGEAEE